MPATLFTPKPLPTAITPAPGTAAADIGPLAVTWVSSNPGVAPLDPASFSITKGAAIYAINVTANGDGSYTVSTIFRDAPLDLLAFKAAAKTLRGIGDYQQWSITLRGPFGNARCIGSLFVAGGTAAQSRGDILQAPFYAARARGDITNGAGGAARAKGSITNSATALAARCIGEVAPDYRFIAARTVGGLAVVPFQATQDLASLLVGFSGLAADQVRGRLTVARPFTHSSPMALEVGIPASVPAMNAVEVQAVNTEAALTALVVARKGALADSPMAVVVGRESATQGMTAVEVGLPVVTDAPAAVNVDEGKGPDLHITLLDDPLAKVRE